MTTYVNNNMIRQHTISCCIVGPATNKTHKTLQKVKFESFSQESSMRIASSKIFLLVKSVKKRQKADLHIVSNICIAFAKDG